MGGSGAFDALYRRYDIMPAGNVKCHGNATLVINTGHPLNPNVMHWAFKCGKINSKVIKCCK